MLPIRLSEAAVDDLFRRAAGDEYHLSVDLESQTVTDPAGLKPRLRGRTRSANIACCTAWDDIGLTLAHEDRITDYENRRGMAPVSG